MASRDAVCQAIEEKRLDTNLSGRRSVFQMAITRDFSRKNVVSKHAVATPDWLPSACALTWRLRGKRCHVRMRRNLLWFRTVLHHYGEGLDVGGWVGRLAPPILRP